MSPSHVVAWALCLSWPIFGPATVAAQNFPSKPIRIVTAGAGGGSDFSARIVAQGISGPLGQPVIVENRAIGALSAITMSQANPDGYTLFINGSSVWTLPLFRKVAYDPVIDFAPISLLIREAYIVAVNPSVPVKSVNELIALAKAKPGYLNYAAGSSIGASFLVAESFKYMAGVNIVHIPHNGTGPSITAAISGEVQMTFSEASSLAAHVRSGKLRALAVTSAQASPLYPDLPTVAASGVPGYEAVGMAGIWGRAKTPKPIITRLNQEIVRVLAQPDVKARYAGVGSEIVASSPEQFDALIKADIAKMRKVIDALGIKPE